MSSFDRAIEQVLKHEGGYVNNPSDKGGETKYGISKKSYPELDIKNLTLDQAKAIYKRDFWDIAKFEEITNPSISIKLFDMSVNMGIMQATKVLQRAIRSASSIMLAEDGILGNKTIAATNNSEPHVLLIALKSEAAGFYRSLVAKADSQKVFLQGWLTRAYA